MADATWKRVEREKCRELGGERSGPTGRDTCDCADPVRVGLEIKSYKTFTFLTKDWEQAVENAAKVGKIPVLAVKERGRNGRDRVQMRLADFNLFAAAVGGAQMRPASVVEFTHDLIRLDWPDFVRLYHAYFKENIG